MKSTPPDVLRRSYRILILALVFFLLSLGILGRWWWQMSRSSGGLAVSLRSSGFAPGGQISGERPVVLASGPEPTKLISVQGPLPQELTVEGICRDQYFTILIFPSDQDYRQNPTSNVYNRATVCTSTEAWLQKLSPANLQLATGTYYLVRADQGAEGSWYNPY